MIFRLMLTTPSKGASLVQSLRSGSAAQPSTFLPSTPPVSAPLLPPLSLTLSSHASLELFLLRNLRRGRCRLLTRRRLSPPFHSGQKWRHSLPVVRVLSSNNDVRAPNQARSNTLKHLVLPQQTTKALLAPPLPSPVGGTKIFAYGTGRLSHMVLTPFAEKTVCLLF